jgi:uncharacterized membrane protein YdjX (TVP38/TMEM64 family)
MAVAVSVPLSSVTVSVTVLFPTLEQSKEVMSVSKLSVPVPVLPLLTASSAMIAFPVPSSVTVMFCVITFGPVGAGLEVRFKLSIEVSLLKDPPVIATKRNLIILPS